MEFQLQLYQLPQFRDFREISALGSIAGLQGEPSRHQVSLRGWPHRDDPSTARRRPVVSDGKKVCRTSPRASFLRVSVEIVVRNAQVVLTDVVLNKAEVTELLPSSRTRYREQLRYHSPISGRLSLGVGSWCMHHRSTQVRKDTMRLGAVKHERERIQSLGNPPCARPCSGPPPKKKHWPQASREGRYGAQHTAKSAFRLFWQ